MVKAARSAEIEARRQERAARLAIPRGVAPEMKYFVAANTMGVVSGSTWSALIASNGVWSSIAQGTDQDDRLGRRIRVMRYRVVCIPSSLAAETEVGLFTVTRTDSNIASSDLFVLSGAARSAADYPNPVGQSAVHQHTYGTAMELCGATRGTTPSYCDLTITHDVAWKKGHVVSYDPSGPTGPLPMTYYNVDETGITVQYCVQVWFQDA